MDRVNLPRLLLYVAEAAFHFKIETPLDAVNTEAGVSHHNGEPHTADRCLPRQDKITILFPRPSRNCINSVTLHILVSVVLLVVL